MNFAIQDEDSYPGRQSFRTETRTMLDANTWLEHYSFNSYRNIHYNKPEIHLSTPLVLIKFPV